MGGGGTKDQWLVYSKCLRRKPELAFKQLQGLS